MGTPFRYKAGTWKEKFSAQGCEGEGKSVLALLTPASGVYQCHVSNIIGMVISTTAFCIQSVQIIRKDLIVLHENSITTYPLTAFPHLQMPQALYFLFYVTWSIPQSHSFHPFLLRYEILTTNTLTSSGTFLPFMVEGLNESSEYHVRVKSWSPVGQGVDGQEQTVYTYGAWRINA